MAEEIARSAGGVAMDALFRRMEDLVTAGWDFSLGLVVNLILLPRNSQNLEEEMARLQELRDDLSNQAEQEARGAENEVTQQLSGWMNRVDTLRSMVTKFQEDFERQSICICGFCLGYSAVQLLRRVNKLTVQGNALPRSELVCRRGPDAVEEVPFETSISSMVGAEETLRRIQGHILDNGVGTIGIYGMGGIGKTTLLQIINNEFLQGEEASGLFDVAIWVTVSKDVDILGIQKAIGDRVGLSLSDDDTHRQAKAIFRVLSKKRFILLLDDVWQKLDLVKIGIPPSKNVKINRKILFTTRSEQVCNEMDADERVKVSLLHNETSMKLFKSKLSTGAVMDDDDIQQLAKQVVAKCGGLPISLITVGRAMSNARTPSDWRHAINALDHWAMELSGMDTVLASLKFSFDMLKDDTLRSCLLYCALFPEDFNIPKGKIIDYWVCEGFLDRDNIPDVHLDDTRDRGHARIRDLQNACLLEEGDRWWDEETVRLHDTVRDMVLWITGPELLVFAGRTNTACVPQWEIAKMVSWESSMLPYESLNCPNMTTLLLFLRTNRPLEPRFQIPEGFFTHMPALRVLDLSSSFFRLEFPIEITFLVQLQYLNLTSSRVPILPREFGNLVNLRHLILEHNNVRPIPWEAVSPLTRLQVLKMRWCGYVFGREACHPLLELNDLEHLKQLSELSLSVQSWPSLEKIVDSDLLEASVTSLTVIFDHGSPSGTIMAMKIGKLSNLRDLSLHDNPKQPMEGELRFHPGQLPNLESLTLENFTNVKVLELLLRRLRRLDIGHCHGFTELTWVCQLACLERISVHDCHGMTELLADGSSHPSDDSSSFPKLRGMILSGLPALDRISTRPLLLPSMEGLYVWYCPCLKQLPFGPGSAKNLREIRGEQTWWDELEWDNHPDGSSAKSEFHSYFKA